MSLTTAEERDLIAAAQHGDTAAYEELWAAYEPYRGGAVARFARQGYARDEAEGEVGLAFAEAVAAAEPGTERLAGVLAAEVRTAEDRLDESLHAITIPHETLRLARAGSDPVGGVRSADTIAAARSVMRTSSLFAEADTDDEGGVQLVDSLAVNRTGGAFTQTASIDSGPSDAELADVALGGMTERQEELARIKYGFLFDLPTEAQSRGLGAPEVAEHYSRPRIGDSAVDEGQLAISRPTVQREIEAGHARGRMAIDAYLATGAE